MHIFLVLGYGVPSDILSDGNYNAYLHHVLASAYDLLAGSPKETVLLVCSGGPTDMEPPYRRTEAGEMARWFQERLERPVFGGVRRRIEIRKEAQSLSTLDNLLRFRDMGIPVAKGMRLVVFCEKTRLVRVKTFAQEVLIAMPIACDVRGIDFDQTDNRFRDPASIQAREDAEMRIARRATRSAADLAEYRKLFGMKIAKLREAGPGQAHVDAVHAWWKTELAALAARSDVS